MSDKPGAEKFLRTIYLCDRPTVHRDDVVMYGDMRAQEEREKSDRWMKATEVEDIAELLHENYLEATRSLSPESYNPNAQKTYAELSDEQKQIDRFIAQCVLRGHRAIKMTAEKKHAALRAWAERVVEELAIINEHKHWHGEYYEKLKDSCAVCRIILEGEALLKEKP